MDKSSKYPLFPSIPNNYLPPTPTPTPHHLNRRAYGSSTGHDSPQRSCIDTPLSLYASTRTRLREEIDSYASVPVPWRRKSIQVPLSALCAPKAVLGAVGGTFNSTTKVKSFPLPSIYNRHQLSSRGVRNVGLHTDRYLPTTRSKTRRTVSDSLVNFSRIGTKQSEHLIRCETGIMFSRKIQKDGEVTPHRVQQSYYMNGRTAQLFNREEIPQNELEVLQKMALSQNTRLYYGKGIQSFGGRTSKIVKQFEDRLQETISANNHGSYTTLEDIDANRYSRASRAVTPGSPIIEENEHETEQVTSKVPSDTTFMTEQNDNNQPYT